MNFHFLIVITGFIFLLTFGFQATSAQSPMKVSAKESSLIAQLVKEANRPGAHSKGDVYLVVRIGKTEYYAELKSGKVVSRKKAAAPSGGICGEYAEVSINLLDKNKHETAQGAGQVMRFRGDRWRMIALSEGDYSCDKLKGISKAVMKCLKIECF